MDRRLRRRLARRRLGLLLEWLARHWATSAPPGTRNTPLRTERARRAALVEIDALVAVWLGMDVDALIAIYQAAFPVLNRYEEITWFDANGWKLAGYHRTLSARSRQKDSYGSSSRPTSKTRRRTRPRRLHRRRSTRPTGSAEYRQAHAAFTERMKGAAS